MPNNRIHSNAWGDRFFYFCVYFLAALAFILTAYPFIYIVSVSISNPLAVAKGQVLLWPIGFSTEGYKIIFNQSTLWTSYGNTLFITVVGTMINMVITIMTSYVLSKNYLRGHRVLTFLCVFTMMFSGGIIPTYMVIKDVGLLNKIWAMIIPTAINTYNMIILRNFFSAMPRELEESATLDGCTEVGVLFRIVLPVSIPAITTVTLFYAVDHWNDFFSAIMYINKQSNWPLQLFLRSMLYENEAAYQSGGESLYLLGQPMKMAAVMMAIIPIMCAYPFFQKYFTKGVMTGAVKG